MRISCQAFPHFIKISEFLLFSSPCLHIVNQMFKAWSRNLSFVDVSVMRVQKLYLPTGDQKPGVCLHFQFLQPFKNEAGIHRIVLSKHCMHYPARNWLASLRYAACHDFYGYQCGDENISSFETWFLPCSSANGTAKFMVCN